MEKLTESDLDPKKRKNKFPKNYKSRLLISIASLALMSGCSDYKVNQSSQSIDAKTENLHLEQPTTPNSPKSDSFDTNSENISITQSQKSLILELESGNPKLSEPEILKVSYHGIEDFKTNGGGVTEVAYHQWLQDNGLEQKPLEKMTMGEFDKILESYQVPEWSMYPEAIQTFLFQVNYNSPQLSLEIEQHFSSQLRNSSHFDKNETLLLLEQMAKYQIDVYSEISDSRVLEGLIKRVQTTLSKAKNIQS